MAYLAVEFSSIMQSWGGGVRRDDAWMDRRRTGSGPCRSTIVGMIGRAEWKHSKEELQEISNNIKSITVLRRPKRIRRMVDDQNISISDYYSRGLTDGLPAAKGGFRRTNAGLVMTMQRKKDYLVDVMDIEKDGKVIPNTFIVALEGDDDFLKEVRYYFTYPLSPVYIGRYCCLPAKELIPRKHSKIYKTLDELKEELKNETLHLSDSEDISHGEMPSERTENAHASHGND